MTKTMTYRGITYSITKSVRRLGQWVMNPILTEEEARNGIDLARWPSEKVVSVAVGVPLRYVDVGDDLEAIYKEM